jgi:hypothetical protein
VKRAGFGRYEKKLRENIPPMRQYPKGEKQCKRIGTTAPILLPRKPGKSAYLKMPKGFPSGKKGFPKKVFSTTADAP